MHILFVADGDSKYGAQNSLMGLVRSLKILDPNLRISVVLTRRNSNEKDFENIGCSVYRVPYKPFYQAISYVKVKLVLKYIVRGIQYLYGKFFALKALEKQLDINSVDIIHANSSREDFGGQIVEKYKKPMVWHIREFGDLDYKCYSCRRNYIAYMNQHTTVFIAISDAVRQHWISKGLLKEKIRLIYNGVKAVRLEEKHIEDDKVLRLVMMGSICETKGQHQIIRAIALLPDEYKKVVLLDIVGDGVLTYWKVINNLVRTLHVEDHIRFLGYQRNFSYRLSEYDCGVMCSRSEGFGRVTAEYMMAGLPVVASNTGANPEIIEDGRTGFLYHYPDVTDLRDKLIYIIEHRNEVRRMGNAAAETALQRFTEKKNAEAVYELYRELIEGDQL